MTFAIRIHANGVLKVIRLFATKIRLPFIFNMRAPTIKHTISCRLIIEAYFSRLKKFFIFIAICVADGLAMQIVRFGICQN
ncbi:MAG: hypothetical protein CL546_13500 [Alcanivorax sp.]|nr:hypothetical protein [Alcanivorax sp.]